VTALLARPVLCIVLGLLMSLVIFHRQLLPSPIVLLRGILLQ
jgi:hypothetical protein